ncbi:MAG TPA: hypothetical protein VL181_03650 [Holophagaceae bacterium]|nr:hypothetical protein [Holophagaceae bacterium]
MGMVGLAIALRVQENAGKAWPISRAVVARLATDEGARDLYAKNPRLAEDYPSPDAFLAAVAAQRSAFGALPARRSDQEFQAESDPDSLSVEAKGTGGAWMELNVERSDGSAAGHAAIGEGITYLGFAADEAGLEAQRKALRAVFHEARWAEFRAVEQAMLTDEGVEALLKAQPALAKDEAARAAFLKQAQSWRPRLAVHQPPATWKEAEAADEKDELVSMQRRSGDGWGDHLEVGWRLRDHAWFRATWEDGHLSKVTVGD